MSKRDEFLKAMHDLVGKPVLWRMKGPDAFDCSGSVTYPLKLIGGPDLTLVDNAQALYDATRELGAGPTDTPIPGDLVFYGLTGPKDIEHVAIVSENGGVISADGATSTIDPKVLGLPRAMALTLANPSHRVRLHNTPRYRSDTKFIVVHRNTLVDALDGVSR